MTAEPGILGPPAELQPLGRVSPSHFTGMQACALREVWSANGAQPLLPPAPAALLGTVIHRLLEEAGRGSFGAAPAGAIERRWEELLEAAEDVASQNWLQRHLVPLASTVPDFEVRELQAIAAACELAEQASSIHPATDRAEQPVLGCEVRVATPDGEAGGRVDVVAPAAGGPVLKDYKTGAVLNGGGQRAVKPGYATQLKLYAAIYAAMTGTWPSELQLVPVAGDAVTIPFTREECEDLLAAAVRLRRQINAAVTSTTSLDTRMEQLAKPAPGECAHCPYRPHCSPYHAASTRDVTVRWPADARGRLRERVQLGNGRLLIVLETNAGDAIHIRGVDPRPQRHPALQGVAPGEMLAAFNLRRAGSNTSFAEGVFTTFYRLAPPPLRAADA